MDGRKMEDRQRMDGRWMKDGWKIEDGKNSMRC